MATVNVLKYLKRKKSGKYDDPVVYIGAEQRFVSPMRGSNNNNLEEQNILGVDFIATSHWDANGTTLITRQEFRNDATVSEYYVLEIYKYNAPGGGGEFTDNELILNSNKIYFKDIGMVIEDDQAEFQNGTINNQVIIPVEGQNDSGTINPSEQSGYIKTEEEFLYYINKSGTKILISSKALYKKEENGTTYIKSVISKAV